MTKSSVVTIHFRWCILQFSWKNTTALISCAAATVLSVPFGSNERVLRCQPQVQPSVASTCCSTHSYFYSIHVRHKHCSKVAFVSLSFPKLAIVFTDEERHLRIRQQTRAVSAICKRFRHMLWSPHADLPLCPDKDTIKFEKCWLYLST